MRFVQFTLSREITPEEDLKHQISARLAAIHQAATINDDGLTVYAHRNEDLPYVYGLVANMLLRSGLDVTIIRHRTKRGKY